MARFILSRKKAVDQYNKIKSLCDIVSYSSKTNPIITKILEESTDSMFSIHMKNELKYVKDKSRVIFLVQVWDKKKIKELVSYGIRYFVVDNESDLDILVEFLETSDVEINLLLRVKLKENTLKTERYFVFGMNSETVNKKIRELRKNKKIKYLGIHFHRKTQNMSEWNYEYEIKNILNEDVFDMIDLINIGGGIPAEYANTNFAVIDNIFEKIKLFRRVSGNKKLIIEPGRFIAAPAVKLETKIIGIHENNIIVDVSVYNSDMDALIVPVKLIVEGELEKGHPYVIKGVTPCSMDMFRYRVYLKNPKSGDKIVFLNAGAYNFKTNFCDLEKIDTVVID